MGGVGEAVDVDARDRRGDAAKQPWLPARRGVAVASTSSISPLTEKGPIDWATHRFSGRREKPLLLLLPRCNRIHASLQCYPRNEGRWARSQTVVITEVCVTGGNPALACDVSASADQKDAMGKLSGGRCFVGLRCRGGVGGRVAGPIP